MTDSIFCACGVTLVGDPGEADGLCVICAAAPHDRGESVEVLARHPSVVRGPGS